MILNGELHDMKVSRGVRRAVGFRKEPRPTLLFFMVMPGMVGGFLRRDTNYFNNRFNYLNNNYLLFALDNFKWAELFNMLYLNQGMAEGLMNRRNSQTNYKEKSKRFDGCIIYISLTKVNFRIKIDPTTVVCVSYEQRVSLRKIIIRNRDYIIVSLLNIETGRDLYIIKVFIIYNYMDFNEVINQHGNFGKYLISLLNIQYRKNARKFSYVLDLYIYKVEKWEIYKLNGGKIAEKAKAEGNSSDIRIKCRINKRYLSIWNFWPLIGGLKQNSVLHYNVKLDKSHVRHYTIQNLEEKSSRKDNVPSWPSNEELRKLEERVYEKQMDLVGQAKKFGTNDKAILRRQMVLAMSYDFRVLAVSNLLNSSGNSTPGIDGITLTNKSKGEEKINLVEKLKEDIKHSNRYKATAVKRVYIFKTNGKKRPIGIPNIHDRGLQHLVKLVLEPLIEMKSDEHSYGFRRYRTAKNAIGILRAQFRTNEFETERKWILDADIKGFFDNINHDWLLSNIPLGKELKCILKSWLKAGFIEKNVFYENDFGTPQGGVISPVLANFTLNGLEEIIYSSIFPLTRSQERRIVIKYKDGSKTRIPSNLFVVRYADDFVVLGRSEHLLKKYVIPKIKLFLLERGLSLSSEKTRLYTLSDKKSELNFLGYTLKYQSNWKYDRAFIKNHSGERGIAIYPNKEKVYAIIRKLKGIIRKSQNVSSYTLISLLNPIIVGWANYYNIGNSSRFRDYVRQALWKMSWNWCKRKHKRWGKKRIASYYFLNKDNSSFKGRTWTFYGLAKTLSRYDESRDGKDKRIYLQDVSNTNTILASKEFIIPKKLLSIHAFDKDYMKLVEFQATLNFKTLGKYNPRKGVLLKKQNGLCSVCNKLITLEQMANGWTHIHHIVPIFKGGSRGKLENMQLLHSWCHREINHFK
jgi:RNA-directed DNA polymerase